MRQGIAAGHRAPPGIPDYAATQAVSGSASP